MCDVEPDLTLDAVRFQHALELHLLHQSQFRRRACPNVGDFFDLRVAISHALLCCCPSKNPPALSSSSTLFLIDTGDLKK